MGSPRTRWPRSKWAIFVILLVLGIRGANVQPAQWTARHLISPLSRTGRLTKSDSAASSDPTRRRLGAEKKLPLKAANH
jgi:hypothetical protein